MPPGAIERAKHALEPSQPDQRLGSETQALPEKPAQLPVTHPHSLGDSVGASAAVRHGQIHRRAEPDIRLQP